MFILRVIRKILSISSVYIARDFFKKPSHQKQYILTFDDGPHPEWTPKLLDLLQRHNVKGLFFVVGECVDLYPDVVKRIHRDGHVICNHSYWHKDVMQISWVEYRDNYLKNEALLREFLDIKTTKPLIYRPPRGWIGPHAMIYFMLRRVPVLMWSTDSRDSVFKPVDEIVSRMTSLQNQKEVLLFHDDSSLVLDILERVIPTWREQGVQLPELKGQSD